MLILSIAQCYYENRSKNKLKKLLLFYKFFDMNSQIFHLIASDAFWANIVECKNNLVNLNWNVPGTLLS